MPLRCGYNCGTNHFHQVDFCLAEMKKPTRLSNKSSTAWSWAENQIFVGFLRIKSWEQDFKYLYWRISKILLWHVFTWKGIYMIDWVGRMRWPWWVGSLNCCNTLQHTATHCNTLQHTATLQHIATHCNACNTLQRTATHNKWAGHKV